MSSDPELPANDISPGSPESVGKEEEKRPDAIEVVHGCRRSFLQFLWGCGVLGVFSLVIAAGVDQIWRKFKDLARETRSRIPGGSPKRKPSFGIQKGKLENEDEYRAFLATIPMQFITPREVIRPHRNIRNGVKNELPPKRSWKQIREVLLVADAVRKELDVPLKMINSAYRSPDYNAECNGAVSKSYHTRNLALDLIYACPSGDAARAARKLRDEGLFKGGIGVYTTFIHIDTRGRNANWGIELEESSSSA